MPDTKRVSILKLKDQKTRRVDDDVVMEEPLEIRVNGERVSVTMRTPGNDFDLAVRLLWTEQIVSSREEIRGTSMNVYSHPQRIVYPTAHGH